MSFKTVKLTILSQDDVEDAKKSQKEPLKNRIVRLTNEALEQGTLLTQRKPVTGISELLIKSACSRTGI